MKYRATFNTNDLVPFIDEVKTTIQYEVGDLEIKEKQLTTKTAEITKEAVEDMIELFSQQLKYEFGVKV